MAYLGLCTNLIFYTATLFQVGGVNESRGVGKFCPKLEFRRRVQGKLCPKLEFPRRVQGKLCPKLDFCRRVLPSHYKESCNLTMEPNNQNIVPIKNIVETTNYVFSIK